MIEVYLTGNREMDATLGRAAVAVSATGGLGRAVQVTGQALQRYAARVTHVDTGTLSGAHRFLMVSDAHGVVTPGDDRNPRSGQPASRYAPFEHRRGGGHAFYARTLEDAGRQAAEDALRSQVVEAIE